MHGEGSMAKRRYGIRTNSLIGILFGIISGMLLASWSGYRFITCGLSHGRCCILGQLSNDPVQVTDTSQPYASTSCQQTQEPQNVRKSTKNFILIGVMTAKKYLNTRAIAAYKTWARSINGEVIFFSSETSQGNGDLPVVGLRGVDDTYPPQKKSFSMLKYMHDHYIDEFEWFMRADDDVYIKGSRLQSFLRSINSSKPQFIGQAGLGTKEESGLLKLKENENFCMGGPGIVFSRATLKLVASHVDHCMQSPLTLHEDVEIGRCVQRYAGISCTWAFEMQHLFFHNYKEEKGSFTYSLNKADLNQAITLHPIKEPTHQFRVHNYILGQRISSLRQKTLNLHREINSVNQLLGEQDSEKPNNLGLRTSITKYNPKDEEDVFEWDFFTRPLYSAADVNPKRGMPAHMRVALDDIIQQTIHMINGNARQRGRHIDFKEILYGYRRLNPYLSCDYILDLLLIYRKHKGRRMTVPVRRHAYLQQNFGPMEILEDYFPSNKEEYISYDSVHPFAHLFTDYKSPERTNVDKTKETIHIVLSLSGRYETFKRFMKNYEQIVLIPKEKVHLNIVLFDSTDDTALQKSINLIVQYQQRYGANSVELIEANGAFSRAKALKLGSSDTKPNSLLFFMDVDILVSRDVFQRVRMNTRQGLQVYFPIVFSQFDTRSFCPDPVNCKFDIRDFRNDYGNWRQFGFGIASIYKSDLEAVGGFDTSIQGWGKEDVDLYQKFINSNLTIFRTVDPGLYHAFHHVSCDPALEPAQYQMCLGSRASGYQSVHELAKQFYSQPHLLNSRPMDSNHNS
ncbi:chondroitin sulfate synthase 1-like [Octopus vulgaris]|uniref:Hexosyltransferase n=1 Tax=Octopus vulgaris TaxID=6645 RepID=A0AA36ALR5_OCTVU|nr:chondroitin sulfate synthase 1-like [Octopus vulgaris]